MQKAVVFVEMIFGFIIFVRIADGHRTQNLISASAMTKIVSAYLCWILVWALFLKSNVFFFALVVWMPILFICFCPVFIKQARKKKFLAEQLQFLNHVILKMRAGVAFYSALKTSSQILSPHSRAKIEKIQERLTLDPQAQTESAHDYEIEELLQNLRQATMDSHRSLARLSQYRDKLRIESDFRKKLTQATMQTQIQAMIMSALYLGLLIYILSSYGWSQYLHFIVLSFFGFVIGLIWCLKIGRNYKWKV